VRYTGSMRRFIDNATCVSHSISSERNYCDQAAKRSEGGRRFKGFDSNFATDSLIRRQRSSDSPAIHFDLY